MEPLASKSVFFEDFLIYLLSTICLVHDDRMSNGCHVDADLMRPPGEELNLEERILASDVLKESEVSAGKFRIDRIFDCHSLAIIGIASDVGFDHPLGLRHESVNHCEIEFTDFSVVHLLLEGLHGAIIFGDEDESARVFVEPVDDPRSLNSVDHREIPEVMEERIDERPRAPIFPGNRMRIDPRIFTHNREIRIFENHLQWHILSFYIIFFGPEFHRHHVPPTNPLVAIEYFPIDRDTSSLDEALHIRPRVVRKKSRQIHIDPSYLLMREKYRKFRFHEN